MDGGEQWMGAQRIVLIDNLVHATKANSMEEVWAQGIENSYTMEASHNLLRIHMKYIQNHVFALCNSKASKVF